VFVDPRTGEDRWAADLGPGVQHVGASATGDHVYVATSRALFAFDASSGAKRWWSPLTPDDAVPVTRR
jgi:outer membrane protein assembly factor BamB